ncbi:hypothetical protein Tsubulata_027597 [Turnera subulata]|uniref:Bidirectional sugar transporter SWEET n=1 Tax=Turnera subulata TaxID=218843 RepID=A0A9Q0J2K0_9ROSI|nr:hypothetical protein Tsubulata_027597 [Turnera subulata]
MGDRLRLAVGIMGNAASLLLYAAPILTFSRIARKKSTEGFSCVPYILALLNCLLYTWYGLPVVSYRWENFPVKKVGSVTTPVLLLFCTTATISALLFHTHQTRKAFVGSVALVASVAMYGSPLVVMKQVIRTKSVEFMPFYLSLFSFLASALWMAYGLLSHDLFLAVGNKKNTPYAFFP